MMKKNLICPKCDTVIEGTPKFCPECGFKLTLGGNDMKIKKPVDDYDEDDIDDEDVESEDYDEDDFNDNDTDDSSDDDFEENNVEEDDFDEDDTEDESDDEYNDGTDDESDFEEDDSEDYDEDDFDNEESEDDFDEDDGDDEADEDDDFEDEEGPSLPSRSQKPAKKANKTIKMPESKPLRTAKTQPVKKAKGVPKDFDPNHDHYYDDVLPEIMDEINKFPTEVILKIGFGIVALVATILYCVYYLTV